MCTHININKVWWALIRKIGMFWCSHRHSHMWRRNQSWSWWSRDAGAECSVLLGKCRPSFQLRGARHSSTEHTWYQLARDCYCTSGNIGRWSHIHIYVSASLSLSLYIHPFLFLFLSFLPLFSLLPLSCVLFHFLSLCSRSFMHW